MEEQMVSLEAAKMLKEKGFDVYCENIIREDNGIIMKTVFRTNKNLPKLCYSRPTQALAAKWLREKHEINVSVLRMTERYGGAVARHNLLKYFWHIQIPNRQSIVDVGVYYFTYEEAFEAGIKEALKHIGL